MSQNQSQKKNRLWRDIKTQKKEQQKNSQISETNPHQKIVLEQTYPKTQPHHQTPNNLETALNSFKQHKNSLNLNHQFQLNREESQHNKNKHFQSQNQMIENKAQAARPMKINYLSHSDDNQEKMVGFQNLQESVTQEVIDIENIDFKNEEPLIHSLTQENLKKINLKSKTKQNLKQLKRQISNLTRDINDIHNYTQEYKFLFYTWLFGEAQTDFMKAYEQVLEARQNNQKNSRIQESIIEIQQLRRSTNVAKEIHNKKIEQKNQQINSLNMKIKNQQLVIRKLEKELQKAQQQISTLNQQIFDNEQRIAQIDLQVEEKVRKSLNRQDQDKDNIQKEKASYLKQIRELQARLQHLSQKFQIESAKQSEINKFQEELNEREYGLQIHEKQIQNKQLELQMFYEELKAKEEHLLHEQKNLFLKLAQLQEKQAKILQISSQQVPKYGYQFNEPDFIDSKNYYIRGQVKNEPQFKHKRNGSSHQKQKDIDYDTISQKSYSKLRKIKQNQGGRQNIPVDIKKSIRNNKLRQSAVATGTKNRSFSNSSQNNDRLHNLGSKLERLRQEIRKQINDAR